MEWLKLSEKIKTNHSTNLIRQKTDYEQYACYDISHSLKLLYEMGFDTSIDTDNSNVSYTDDYTLALSLQDTAKGTAFMLTFLSPWFAPLPVLSLETYKDSYVKLLKSEGKLVFYGAYFSFEDILLEEAPQVVRFKNQIQLSTVVSTSDYKWHKENTLYKRTRLDYAFDITLPVHQKWMKHYIVPHKNSKTAVKPYNYQKELWGWQSLSYLGGPNFSIGIRIYNKVLDIQSKKKQSWYPDYWTEKYPIVTRIELVFWNSYAHNSTEQLVSMARKHILGENNMINVIWSVRPKSLYTPRNAYIYISRYAKNHGYELSKVIQDVSALLLEESNRKD